MAEASAFARLNALISLSPPRALPDWAAEEEAWGPVLLLAGSHLVTPSLAGALARQGLGQSLPRDVRDVLEATRELNLQRNGKLRSQLGAVAAALNGIGIAPVALKGAIALAAADYPGAEDRMVGDLDLLVPQARLGDATAAIIALGYRPAEEEWRRMLARDKAGMHHVIPLLHPSLPVAVELHGRILENAADDAALFSAMEINELRLSNGAAVMIPDRATRLIHNLLHQMVQDRAQRSRGANLRQLLEFVRLAGPMAEGLDPAPLLARLRPQRRPLLALQWALAARWLGLTPVTSLGLTPRQSLDLWLFEAGATSANWHRALHAWDEGLRLPRRALNVVERRWEKMRERGAGR